MDLINKARDHWAFLVTLVLFFFFKDSNGVYGFFGIFEWVPDFCCIVKFFFLFGCFCHMFYQGHVCSLGGVI